MEYKSHKGCNQQDKRQDVPFQNLQVLYTLIIYILYLYEKQLVFIVKVIHFRVFGVFQISVWFTSKKITFA